jgi:hypothetical protein
MTIDDELKALLLMSSLPPSWETFVMTVCNASVVAVKYSEITSSILFEDARTKAFIQNSASDAYNVQSMGYRPQHHGRSSSCRPNAMRNWSKSRDLRMCDYCKKPGHIKAYCRALKEKNDKFSKRAIVRRR